MLRSMYRQLQYISIFRNHFYSCPATDSSRFSNPFSEFAAQKSLTTYSVKTMHQNFRLFSSHSNLECWNCKNQVSISNAFNVFCQSCNVIQNSQLLELNYFKLLDYDQPTFKIDISDLANKMKQLQTQLHPDKFSSRSEVERNFATDWSSLVNNAYRQLHSPVKRAQYLLEILLDYKEDDLGGSQLNYENSSEFLADMIELNEDIEELTDRLIATKDPKDIKEFESLTADINSKFSSIIEELSQNFESKDFDKAVSNFHQLKFYSSVLNRIKEFEHSQL